MNKLFKTLRRTLRFRHWSRKAYSLFISCSNHVTIGHVCKSIVDASCRKSEKAINVACSSCLYSCRTDDGLTVMLLSDEDLGAVDSVCGFSMFPVHQEVDANACGHALCSIDNSMFNIFHPMSKLYCFGIG